MDICHRHNLIDNRTSLKPYGIRVTMRKSDTLARVLGTDWEHLHWFATRAQRDAKIKDMASEHLYSRRGDRPTLDFDPVEQAQESAQ